LDQEELNALRQVISDELQDMGQVLQTHEDGINELTAEKIDDRNVMSVIQRRLDSLHRRVSNLHQRVTILENQPPTGK
jgi:sensor c-di-GMP phosphodiesterase-like protein